VLWLRVSGRGSYEISPYLSRFATARIAEGVRQIVVDLEACPVMDSTFMGTLTGIAVRLTELPGGRLQVVNPNERNRSLLSNLGLDQIFEVDAEGRTWPHERALVSRMLADEVCDSGEPVAKREQCECMIDAHEALARAQPANVPRFQDVIECLKREMQALPA
jgi:anti-anti-sigma regulatory factor